MTRPKIIMNVHGGALQDVFSSIPDMRVLIVNWDTEGLNSPSIVELSLDGRPCTASVVEMNALPLEELAWSDVERAIDAACEQEVLQK